MLLSSKSSFASVASSFRRDSSAASFQSSTTSRGTEAESSGPSEFLLSEKGSYASLEPHPHQSSWTTRSFRSSISSMVPKQLQTLIGAPTNDLTSHIPTNMSPSAPSAPHSSRRSTRRTTLSESVLGMGILGNELEFFGQALLAEDSESEGEEDQVYTPCRKFRNTAQSSALSAVCDDIDFAALGEEERDRHFNMKYFIPYVPTHDETSEFIQADDSYFMDSFRLPSATDPLDTEEDDEFGGRVESRNSGEDIASKLQARSDKRLKARVYMHAQKQNARAAVYTSNPTVITWDDIGEYDLTAKQQAQQQAAEAQRRRTNKKKRRQKQRHRQSLSKSKQSLSKFAISKAPDGSSESHTKSFVTKSVVSHSSSMTPHPPRIGFSSRAMASRRSSTNLFSSPVLSKHDLTFDKSRVARVTESVGNTLGEVGENEQVSPPPVNPPPVQRRTSIPRLPGEVLVQESNLLPPSIHQSSN